MSNRVHMTNTTAAFIFQNNQLTSARWKYYKNHVLSNKDYVLLCLKHSIKNGKDMENYLNFSSTLRVCCSFRFEFEWIWVVKQNLILPFRFLSWELRQELKFSLLERRKCRTYSACHVWCIVAISLHYNILTSPQCWSHYRFLSAVSRLYYLLLFLLV